MRPVVAEHLRTLPQAQRAKLAMEIVLAYCRVRWAMRNGQDAAVAVRRLRSRFDRDPLVSSSDYEFVVGWRLGKAVTKTLRPLPTDSRCLYQSLTLMTVMERRGLRPALVIAVRSSPFAAHAWIEHRGHALLPDADPGFERLVEL